MTELILASTSPQRRNLFRQCGLRFKIVPSRVEEVHKLRASCSALVKHNALLKAKDVAQRVKRGIVVGADTLVYSGHRQVIGKPRDLREAKKTLQVLFSRPHWVYTGLAVIDAATGKTAVDYEKTKVFMNRLSNKEIDRYHAKMFPLDKAGGFDIEGHGALFIRRIEGCYTNVIGLPMAKLREILKKFDIYVF